MGQRYEFGNRAAAHNIDVRTPFLPRVKAVPLHPRVVRRVYRERPSAALVDVNSPVRKFNRTRLSPRSGQYRMLYYGIFRGQFKHTSAAAAFLYPGQSVRLVFRVPFRHHAVRGTGRPLVFVVQPQLRHALVQAVLKRLVQQLKLAVAFKISVVESHIGGDTAVTVTVIQFIDQRFVRRVKIVQQLHHPV